MYRCDNCRCWFEEPEEVHTTYEDYNGVSSLFPNSTPLTIYECPNCGSEDYNEELEEDDEEEEDG